MIVDPNGGLVWFKPLPPDTSATDLRVQEYEGKPVLTWWQGDISVHGFGLGEDVIANERLHRNRARERRQRPRRPTCTSSSSPPQGTALVTAYDPILCDLSAVGGPRRRRRDRRRVAGDRHRTGLVMYEWTSLDHVAMSESYEPAAPLDAGVAVRLLPHQLDQPRRDGSLLISARNTWTVYDLDTPQRPDPAGSSGAGTAASRGRRRRAPPGSTTRGNSPDGTDQRVRQRRLADGPPPVARARARAEPRRTDGDAARAHSPHARRWSRKARATCRRSQTATGSSAGARNPFLRVRAHTARLALRSAPSRRRRAPIATSASAGRARPLHPPASPSGPRGGAATVYASWNGATQVASWRVLAGRLAGQPDAGRAGAASSGFETAITLPSSAPGNYLAVQALTASGQVLGTSAAAPA